MVSDRYYSQSLTEKQKLRLKHLNFELQDIFQRPGEKLGHTDISTHKNNTGEHAPIKMPLRRHPMAQKQIIDKTIDKMLEEQIIEPSNNRPWISNLCLVEKKEEICLV